MTIWCMPIAYWITKATTTQSEYVILIAVAQKQIWHERASKLRYKYTPSLVVCSYNSVNKQIIFLKK